MQSKAKTVDEYLAELPEDRRRALATLRKLIKKTAPAAREEMQYGMPAYTLGAGFCAIASQKHYMALYSCDHAVVEKYRGALGKLDCGKGCIRFRRIEQLPMEVISELLREVAALRMAELQEAGRKV